MSQTLIAFVADAIAFGLLLWLLWDIATPHLSKLWPTAKKAEEAVVVDFKAATAAVQKRYPVILGELHKAEQAIGNDLRGIYGKVEPAAVKYASAALHKLEPQLKKEEALVTQDAQNLVGWVQSVLAERDAHKARADNAEAALAQKAADYDALVAALAALKPA